MIKLLLLAIVNIRVVILTDVPTSFVPEVARLESQVTTDARIVDVRIMRDPYPTLNKLAYQIDRLQNLSNWAKKKRLNRGVDQVHFIVSPMIENGALYVGGIARRVCSARSSAAYSMSNYSTLNAFGASRAPHSIIAAAHELGHALGATHQDLAPNIMHSNALSFVTAFQLSWFPISKQQVRSCIR